MNTKPTFYWHVHHNVLAEVATEPIRNRRKYIREHKPANEIELRLKLLKRVRGKLPISYTRAGVAYAKTRAACDKAGAAYVKAGAAYAKAGAAYAKAWAAYIATGAAYAKARAAYTKAWAAYTKAWAAYTKVRAAYDKAGAACDKTGAANMPAILKLHAAECPGCPWDGETIFPKH